MKTKTDITPNPSCVDDERKAERLRCKEAVEAIFHDSGYSIKDQANYIAGDYEAVSNRLNKLFALLQLWEEESLNDTNPTPSPESPPQAALAADISMAYEWCNASKVIESPGKGEGWRHVCLRLAQAVEAHVQLAETNAKALAHYSKLADEHANQADLLNMQLAQSQAREKEMADALKALTQEMEWFYGHTVADITSNSAWREAKAALARHQTAIDTAGQIQR